MKRELEVAFVILSIVIMLLLTFHGLNMAGLNTSSLLGSEEDWVALSIEREGTDILVNVFGQKFFVEQNDLLEKLTNTLERSNSPLEN